MVGSGDGISGAVDLLENVPFTGDVQMEMIMNGSAASYTSEECQGVIIIEVVPVSPGAQLLNGILTFTVDGNAVSSPFGFSWMIDYQTEAPYSNTALHPFTAPAGTEVPVSLFVAMTGFANSSRPINQASYRAKIMQGAWTGLTGNAIMPVALFSTVTLDVESSDWMGIGDTLWFQAGTLGPGIPTGYVEVMSIPSSTQVEIRVLSYVGDNGAGIEVTPGFYLMQRTPNDL